MLKFFDIFRQVAKTNVFANPIFYLIFIGILDFFSILQAIYYLIGADFLRGIKFTQQMT